MKKKSNSKEKKDRMCDTLKDCREATQKSHKNEKITL